LRALTGVAGAALPRAEIKEPAAPASIAAEKSRLFSIIVCLFHYRMSGEAGLMVRTTSCLPQGIDVRQPDYRAVTHERLVFAPDPVNVVELIDQDAEGLADRVWLGAADDGRPNSGSSACIVPSAPPVSMQRNISPQPSSDRGRQKP